jgi:hypothetical protein
MVGNKVTLNVWQALQRFEIAYTKPKIVVNKNQFLFKTEDNKRIMLPSSAKDKTVTQVF